MRNLIDLEVNDINNQIKFKNRNNFEAERKSTINEYDEYNKVKKLMDAKELEDPLRVFKRIEPDLDNPIAYKEYIKKFRNNPKYYEPDHDDEMHWIDFNKRKASVIKSLNDSLAVLDYNDPRDIIVSDIDYVKMDLKQLLKAIREYRLESSDYKTKFGHIKNNLELFLLNITNILTKDLSLPDLIKQYEKDLKKTVHYLQAI